MIISSVLDRENLNLHSRIKILWTPTNEDFTNFVSNLNTTLLNIEQIYYGNSIPNLIICNNKVEYHNTCYTISRKLHLPVLLIDHAPKNPLFDNQKIKLFDNFPCMHHVCISQKISNSWELTGVQILSYNHTDPGNINIWKNLIYQTAKKIFKI